MIESEIIMETFAHGNHDILLGGIAGLVAYLFELRAECNKHHEESNGRCEAIKFNILTLITNIAMGSFVSYIVGTTVLDTNEFRTIIIGFSGFSAYSILALAKSKFAEDLIDRFLSRK